MRFRAHSSFVTSVETVCAALILAVTPLPGAVQQAGNVVSTQIGTDQVDFTLDSGAVARVQTLDSDLVRIRVNPSGRLSSFNSGAVAATGLNAPGAAIIDTGDGVLMSTPLAIISITKTPFAVVVQRPDYSVVSADLPAGGIIWDTASGEIIDQKIADPNEAFFGLGERGGPINRRGRTFLMHNVDSSGYGEFTDPLYISIPFYYGILNGKAYGIFVDNPADPFFDMDSHQLNTVLFGASSGELNYYVMTGPEPSRVANTYGRLTGFNPLPPKWSLGYHQSRYGYKSQVEITTVANEMRNLQIPGDVLWMDIDYMNNLSMFTWNPATFPTPVQMNADLDAIGFKRVNIIEPLIRTDDPLWSFANQSGYFVQNPDGTTLVGSIWYGDISFLDFTSSLATAWYQQSLAGFLSAGANGLWADLNEPAENFMPQATYNFGGTPQRDLVGRNVYALNELSVLNSVQTAIHPNDRPWAIARSGYSGIQRYAANWSGDTLSSFDSLRVSLEMSISMGLSGQNFFGHDVGGFLGSPPAELYLRWLEFGSYIPLFRTHSTNTSAPREPWSFGDPYTGIARNVINQRYKVLPYIYSLFATASTTGTPVVGALPYYFPADTKTFTEDQSYLLGPSLLVAPIVTQGATSRNVYLPQGASWFDYSNDTLYAGGSTATAMAPLDSIPVYVRAGSIIPGGPVMQYVTDPSVAPMLTLDVYPGPDSNFPLYEDDGETMAYTLGAAQQTLLSLTSPNNWTVVTMTRYGGAFHTPNRPIWLYFHAVAAAPSVVYVNQIQLGAATSVDALNSNPGWYYSAADQKLIVRIQDAPGLQVTVMP
jgi:alpha-glucosidase